ncbi:MAG: tRNA pseudouridine(13) synthase TruD [Myxococcaceae bacterium]
MSVLPYLTSDLPGSGGVIRSTPEDFQVDELPAYLPSGEAGEHLFLHLRKKGLSTPELAKRIARALEIDDREVSWAGLKDRHAVTTQWLSVPAKAEPKLAAFNDPDVQLLEAKRHGNKLKNGHLKGNRFQLKIRNAANAEAARTIFERLVRIGVPNYFGEQRFGAAGDNAELGKLLILGQRLPKKPDRFSRKMFLSAFQSKLFNQALQLRLQAGTLATAVKGDVLRKTDTGGMFVCEDPAVDQPRVDRGEVSPAGPIFGPKMTKSAGEVAELEQRLLSEAGVTIEDFKRGKDETEGSRRVYRVLLAEPSIEIAGDVISLAFTLPKGSYATVVLRELMKSEVAAPEGEEE